MPGDDLSPLIDQARQGNREALVDLIRTCTRALRTFIATYAASAAMIAEVERETWLSCRLALPGFPPGSAVLPWVLEHARTVLLHRLEDCDRQAISAQDMTTHIVARSGLDALGVLAYADNQPISEMRERLERLASGTRTMLDLLYAQGLTLAQISSAREITPDNAAAALFAARRQLDWTATADGITGDEDRQFNSLVEHLLAGVLAPDARALLNSYLIKSLIRCAQFERQARLHLMLGAFLGSEPSDHARILTGLVWGGNDDTNRLMFGAPPGRVHDSARLPHVIPAPDLRRSSASGQRNVQGGTSRSHALIAWIAVGLLVATGALAFMLGHSGRSAKPFIAAQTTVHADSTAAHASPVEATAQGSLPQSPSQANSLPAASSSPVNERHDDGSSTFVRGIHFGADAVTIDHHPWLSLGQALRSGLVLAPGTDIGQAVGISSANLDFDTKAMLNSGLVARAGPVRFLQSVPNGVYDLTLWLGGTQGVDVQGVTLALGAAQVAIGQPSAHADTWCRIGPFRTTIGSHTLDVALDGLRQAHLAGMALHAVGRLDGGFPVVISLLSPVAGSVHQADEALLITPDIVGGQVAQVEFFNGERKLGVSENAPFSFTWNHPDVGPFALSARITDASGGISTSPLVSGTIIPVSRAPSTGTLFAGGIIPDLIVWDGDTVTKGQGFTGANVHSLLVQTDMAHSGAALRIEAAGGSEAVFGYNWQGGSPEDAGTDITGFDRFCFWLKIDGPARPHALDVRLASSPKSAIKQSTAVDVMARLPDLADGAWHQVVVPIAELAPPGCPLDLHKTWEFTCIATSNQGQLACTLFIDDVGFAKAGTGAMPSVATAPSPNQAHFVKGINLGGAAVVIDGRGWLSQKQAEEAVVIPPPASPPVYLSDLPWVSASSGFGVVNKDLSNGGTGPGKPLTIRGKVFKKGLGTHAKSEIVYALDGRMTQFRAEVGIDDEVGGAGNVIFEVVLDGTKVFDSGIISGTMPPVAVAVGLIGKKELKLVVDAHDIFSGHADWGDARLLQSGGSSGPLTLHGAKHSLVSSAPKPAVNAAMRSMLNSSVIGGKEGFSLNQPLPLGLYQIFVYVMETGSDNSHSFDLELNGEVAGEALGILNAGSWAKYGPYPLVNNSGALELMVKPRKGLPQLMGLEIWTAGPLPAESK
jgi:DNA-directed RNA polymerase specialized sigma24 family protein